MGSWLIFLIAKSFILTSDWTVSGGARRLLIYRLSKGFSRNESWSQGTGKQHASRTILWTLLPVPGPSLTLGKPNYRSGPLPIFPKATSPMFSPLFIINSFAFMKPGQTVYQQLISSAWCRTVGWSASGLLKVKHSAHCHPDLQHFRPLAGLFARSPFWHPCLFSLAFFT